jgi:predicted  nucleic acid-binding Zn-ribbon protein
MRNDDGMSATKLQIDGELQAAEHALETAKERRRTAEHALWEAVSSSGKSRKKLWRRRERVDEARAALAEAEQVLADSQARVVDLRQQLEHAQQREASLLAVTDMLIARDQARRANGADGPHDGNGDSTHKPGRRLSFLDRFRRH